MSQAARSRRDMMSPVPSGPVSTRHARSAELDSESPWKTRRARRRMQPVRVLEESVGVDLPTLTFRVPWYTMLPVSLRLEDIGPLPLLQTVVSASLKDFMTIGGASLERVAIPELGVGLLVDPDTDLEDELPTPEGSYVAW